MFIFLITLLLFPGTAADTDFHFVNNMNLANAEAWYQLIVVFIFNVFDTVGRYAGGMRALDLKIHTVNIGSAARILFVATFLLVDFEVPPTWLFGLDWFKILNLVLFAFSNGYFSTLCAIKAPGTVKETRRAQVGAYVGTCIAIGILSGAILQVGMTPILALTPKKRVPGPVENVTSLIMNSISSQDTNTDKVTKLVLNSIAYL